ncbi:MAG TPA: chemotaxis protein CheW [Balneolaceae bacterium]|nr:chemotaxis protein CheW [Balneola sp.]HBQ59068.1 chemotaxis protein CheW [Balneolaceae bacterium]|tara:strand:+ start:40074 stop:40589 length:516 start_codon:yes stop_codon:yes gene_type:complete
MEDTIVKGQKAVENGADIEGGKFLSFFLGQEEYAIEILKVQEIIGLMPITPVPKMPDYIRGVLNLRGKIVPVMNLRLRFGLKPVEDTDETCVIVVQDEQHLMGVLVDKVSEVADIIENQIEEVPSFGIRANSDYLAGIAKVKESVKMIVDIHKVVFDVADEVEVPVEVEES